MTKQTFKHYESGKGINAPIVDVTAEIKNFGEFTAEKGSKNPILGILAKQAEKVHGRSTSSNKSKNAFPSMKITSAKDMTDSEFVELATSPDDSRPVLQVAHKNWAADGFRLHFLNGKKDTCKCKFCKNRAKNKSPMTPDYHQIIPTHFNGEFTLNRDAILEAGNICKVFAREGSNIIRILINQESIQFSATSEKLGESSVEYGQETVIRDCMVENDKIHVNDRTYTYSKTGQNLLIAFNVDFLLDAVKGMGETVTVKYSVKNAPILISDAERSAVLMPMRLG